MACQCSNKLHFQGCSISTEHNEQLCKWCLAGCATRLK